MWPAWLQRFVLVHDAGKELLLATSTQAIIRTLPDVRSSECWPPPSVLTSPKRRPRTMTVRLPFAADDASSSATGESGGRRWRRQTLTSMPETARRYPRAMLLRNDAFGVANVPDCPTARLEGPRRVSGGQYRLRAD